MKIDIKCAGFKPQKKGEGWKCECKKLGRKVHRDLVLFMKDVKLRETAKKQKITKRQKRRNAGVFKKC